MTNITITKTSCVKQPRPFKRISLFVTPPLDMKDHIPNRHKFNNNDRFDEEDEEEDEEDEEDDIMDKHSNDLSQLQFTPPSSLKNGNFITIPQSSTTTTTTTTTPSPFFMVTNNSLIKPTSSSKYNQPPLKSSFSKQSNSSPYSSEGSLLSPSKLFKKLSRKFSSSSTSLNSNLNGNSNSNKRNSLIFATPIPKSPSTNTLKSIIELPTIQSEPPIKIELDSITLDPTPSYLKPVTYISPEITATTTTTTTTTTPKKQISRPMSVSMFSPKSLVTKVRVLTNHSESNLGISNIQEEESNNSPIQPYKQLSEFRSNKDKEEQHDKIFPDVTLFSGYSIGRKDSVSKNSMYDLVQKSTVLDNTFRTTNNSPGSQYPFFTPSPLSSNQINNDPITSTPIDIARSSTKLSTSSKISRSQSGRKTSLSSSSNPKQVLVLRIFFRDPYSKEVTSITIKLRKDKLQNINELTNLILYKMMNKKNDLNINEVKLLIFFKDKNLKPILLKDSVNPKSKSLTGVVNKELGFYKDDLLLDYVQMKEKLYIKAIV